MLRIYQLLKESVTGFIEDEALTRGAAIAFYTVTSFAPLLLIVISIAGIAFGRDAAQNAIIGQLSGLMGPQSADFLQSVVAGAQDKTTGIASGIAGLFTLALTATGVFGEMQSALNRVWKVEAKSSGLSAMVRARAASAGLVAIMGFLLLVSLAVSAGLSAFSAWIDAALPMGKWLVWTLNTFISLALIALLFGAIYKVLPDRSLEWRDVIVGAISSAVLFTIGKFLIGWYLGASSGASTYGAAGALILLLLWVYYSVMIFLFGAEFTRAFANAYGSRRDRPVTERKVVQL
jgi:membrane protein